MAKFRKVDNYLFKNEDSGVFFVRKSYKKAGIQELFQSLGTKKVSLARATRDDKIREYENHHLGIQTSDWIDRSPAISEVIDAYMSSIQYSRRKTTLKKRAEYLAELNREFGTLPITRLTIHFWDGWLAAFRKRKTRETFFDYSKSINVVLRYAYRTRLIPSLISVPNPDLGRKPKFRVYTDEEIQRLWSEMGETLRDQFVLSYEHMMRLREVLYLTWERVDLESGLITLRAEDVKTGSKTGKGRQFYIGPNALNRLRERSKVAASPFVFPARGNTSKPQHDNKTAWGATKRRAGIKGRARWHDLRHTALSKALLVAKAESILVSEYSGVSVRTIQSVYLHSRADQTRSVNSAVSILGNAIGRREKGVTFKDEEE